MSMSASAKPIRAIGLGAAISDLARFAFPHWRLWVVVLALAAVNAVWIGISERLTMEPSWFARIAFLSLAALAMLLLRRFKGASFDWFLHRIWCLLLTVLLGAVLTQNLQVFNHLTMTTAWPMADGLLLSWDRALGFDWLAYGKAMTASTTLTKLLFFAYNQLTMGGLALVALGLALLDKRARLIELAGLMTATALVCIVAASFFPARAAMDLLADQELLSRLAIGSGVYHLEQLQALRGTDPLMMRPDVMQGLATFPSFHTCLGLLIIWCSRGNWLSFAPGAFVGATVVAATPIYGGHYLVDLIGGGVVTFASILVWSRCAAGRVADRMPGLDHQQLALPAWLSRRIAAFTAA
jgi:PAP2 superfamily